MLRKERITDLSKILFDVVEIPHVLSDANEKFTDIRDQISGDPGKSIIRLDTNQIISNVSSGYKIEKHADVIEVVEAVFNKNHLNFSIFDIHTGGIAGHRMYVDYIFNDHKVVVDGDSYTPFLQVFNSYDKSTRFGTHTGMYRERCSNGMMFGIRGAISSMRKHYGNFNIMDEALKIDEWIESLDLVGVQLGKLKEMKVDFESLELDVFLTSIFERKSHIKEFTESGLVNTYREELGDNEYALMNALTDFVTHQIENPEKIRSYDMARKLQQKIPSIFLAEV